jgi:glycosyltransferase involved in cell wall biosynthesis
MDVKAGAVITPLVLTFNEAPNIVRTLESLRWADRIVVLDSGSTDETEKLSKQFSNVDWRTRPFDSFKAQTEYGLRQTDIETDYVLALDADMSLSPAVIEEIEARFLPGKFAGGLFAFQYCIAGQPLVGSLYPAQVRLFRRDLIQVKQVGHGHKFHLAGSIYQFKARLWHDDRKPLERWMAVQLAYSAQELQRLRSAPRLGWRDWLRRLGVLPWLIGPYAYFKAGGPLRGAAAARYAYERATFECLLALRWLTERLEKDDIKD